VGEPRETYGNTGLEKMLRDLVKDEIKKNKWDRLNNWVSTVAERWGNPSLSASQPNPR
jgi:hypothetical protein